MDTTKTIAGTDANGFAINTPYQAISTASLAPTATLPVTQPQYKDFSTGLSANNSYVQSAFDTANLNADQANAQALAQAQELAKNQAMMGLKSTDTVQAMKDTGATDLAGQIRKLNAQSNALSIDTQAKTLAEQNKATGQNITGQAVQRNTADVTRENFINQANIAMQVAIKTADYQTAKDLADQIVGAKYDKLEADNNAIITNLQAYKDFVKSPTEKKLADAQIALQEQKKQDLADKKANEKDMQSLSLTVAKNGAPEKVQEIIRNAKDFNEAVIAASPYLTSAVDKADLSYKMAQTAKIYADMKNEAMTVGSNVAPENMLPFAQEYAATGKVPVGAPKGSQASIMRYAKELPQAPGSMVSSVTGVANATLGALEQKDISRLYNVTKAVKELKKLDEERIGGVVSGTLGKVFGSEAQSAYLAKRKSIVDDISRMQSGAALTESEVAFYEDYLPGRLSETVGLGQDSYKKIENFEKIMNEKLKNSLSNNQLSIYGYSTVTLDNGQEYVVGDLIQANGKTGRINPDGSITIID